VRIRKQHYNQVNINDKMFSFNKSNDVPGLYVQSVINAQCLFVLSLGLLVVSTTKLQKT